ncbi:MAG: T9SS type A sorting domain-containing protein [Ignavibacteria bacterium]|nr:T9SS type A sorting domain-containing protein [Ignavibacteria bacterium]
MKKKFTLLAFFLIAISLIANTGFSQLSGTKTIDNTIPTGGNNYQTFTDAFNALNGSGVGGGGVTFNVTAGQTFNEVPPVLNATGTVSDQIIFQRTGAGADPKIMPNAAGTLTTTTLGNNADGIVVINGGDYITFNGIALDGNASYTAVLDKYEYGYYLKKASATDACKNVTIQNCPITLYHLPTTTVTIGCAVFVSNISGTAAVTVTTTGGRSENISISGCTITGSYIGVQLRGYASATPYDLYDQNNIVSGNTITNYGGGASTAYGTYAIYQNNISVANNNITSAASGHTTTLYGIFMSTGNNSSVDIYGNNVTITGGGTTSALYAINNGMGSGATATVNIYNNTVSNCTYPTATTGTMYLIYTTTSPGKCNIYGNTVTNNTHTGTGTMYCLYESGTVVDSVKIYNNTITNNTKTSTGTLYCMYNSPTTTTNSEVYGNLVHSNSAGGGTLYGYYSDGSLIQNVYKNKIYNQTSTGAAGVSYGMHVATGPLTTNIYNNLIGDLKAPSTTSTTDAVRGLSFASVTALSTYNISFNTIYLNATSVGANFSSSGVYHTTSATATSGALNLRSNLVVNTSTPNGTGVTSAYRRSSATLTNYGSLSDNNCFYAGTPGAANLLFYDGTNSDQTISTYKTRVSPRDANSQTENVVTKFLSTSGASSNFLHMDPAQPTQLESGGLMVAGIVDDYDGNARYPNVGYPLNPSFPPTAPDIGADEFGGIPADLSGPVITYTALTNTSSTGSRSLTATITDVAGVQTGANGPRLYYRKSTDPSFIYDDAPSVSVNDYTFNLNTSLLSGVTTGTIIQYYVAAQDLNANTSTNPAGGSGVNPPGTTAPVSPNSYLVTPILSGTYTVGATGNYANLTAVANTLSPSNSEITGNVIFELQNDYDGTTGETLPISFPQFNSSGSYTVTIRPALGVTARVTSGDPGSLFSSGVFLMNGADNFIIDGRPGGTGSSNEWTLRNTRTTATIGCVIRLADGASYNTIRYMNLESQATLTTTAIIFFHTVASGTVGNSNNTIVYNNIRGRTDAPAPMSNGILSNGTAGALNSSNYISNNNFENFSNIGVSVLSAGGGPGWTIQNNHFYSTNTSSSAQTGIALAGAGSTGMNVVNNYIGGSAPFCAGTMTNSGNVAFTGISITGGVANITGNTIANMSGTNTGTTARTRGIFHTSAADSVTIANNNIHDLSSMSGVLTGFTANNQAAVGISVFPGSTFYFSQIYGNTIYNISAENTHSNASTTMAAGMFLTNFTGACYNNKIYDIKNKATGTNANQNPIATGIYSRFFSEGYVINNMISVGTGENTNTQFSGVAIMGNSNPNVNNHYYYNNTIAVSGTAGGTIGSYCFVKGDDTTTTAIQTQYLRNNILYMDRTGGGSLNYAIASKGTSFAVGVNFDYNMLYNVSNTEIGLWGATSYNFANWKTNSLQDANSISPSAITTANLFTSVAAGDMNIISSNVECWYPNGNGYPLSLVATDFSGTSRSTTIATGATDIGADEFTPSIAAPTLVVPVAGIGNYPLVLSGKTIGSVNIVNPGSLDAPITDLNVKFNTGANPPGAPIDLHYSNAYWEVTPNGGASGFTYNITLNYTDALLGTCNEANLRMAKSDNGGTLYTPSLVAGTGPGEYTTDIPNNNITVYGLTSFSLFALTDSDAPLPVELASFTANVDRRNVSLKWTTATEENNAGFDIERKPVSSEMWSKIGNVSGNGTSNSSHNYNYEDRNLVTGKYNYRLKQIDNNGNFKYHTLSSLVDVGVPAKFDMSQNYPNPFNPTTKISYDLPFDSKVQIKMFDMTGREVYQLVNQSLTAGYYTSQFNASALASGVYFYQINAQGGNQSFIKTMKMVLVK